MKQLALKKTLYFGGFRLVSVTQPVDLAAGVVKTEGGPEPEWLLAEVRIPISYYEAGVASSGALRIRPGVVLTATIEVVELDEMLERQEQEQPA